MRERARKRERERERERDRERERERLRYQEFPLYHQDFPCDCLSSLSVISERDNRERQGRDRERESERKRETRRSDTRSSLEHGVTLCLSLPNTHSYIPDEQVNIEKRILRYRERHEKERDGGRERDKVRKIIMKIEIRPVPLSPSSDLLLRERDTIISYYK